MKILLSLNYNRERDAYFDEIISYLAGKSCSFEFFNLSDIKFNQENYDFLKSRHGLFADNFAEAVHIDALRLAGKSTRTFEQSKHWVEFAALKLIEEIEERGVALLTLWNQFKPPHQIFREIAHSYNIPVRFMHLGVLPGSLAFEKNGQMAECELIGLELKDDYVVRTSTASYVEKINKFKSNRKKQPLNDLKTQIEEIGKKYRKTIFYAGQNDFESGIYPRDNNQSKVH